MKALIIFLIGIRKSWRIFFQFYNQLFTHLVFLVNGVEYKSFTTKGIPIITIDGSSKIVVGKSLTMNNGTSNNNIGFNAPCQLGATNGAKLIIGDNVGMSQTSIFALSSDVIVGNNTLFGGGVKVYSSDFHSINWEDRRYPARDKKKRLCNKVIIGHDCFIGAGVIILKGVEIGDRTVIGAGSVVTRSIPSDCIAAGNPAKVLKRR